MHPEYRGITTTIVPLLSLLACAAAQLPVVAEGATRDLPANYSPDVAFTVSIAIDVPAGTLAAAVEDSPPVSWTEIINISEGGTYDAANHKVKWGPFFVPSVPSSVTYDLTPPGGAMGSQCFEGIVSFDGLNQLIGGAACVTSIRPNDWDDDGDVDLVDFAHFADCLSHTGPGNPSQNEQCALVFDSDGDGDVDLVDWAEFQTVFGFVW